MDTVAKITDVSRHFSDYINRTVYKSENFILTRGGKPVAKLSPLPEAKTLGDLLDIVESLPRLSNEELTDFSADIKELRMASGTKASSPWDT